MRKPLIFWVDQLASSTNAEVPTALLEKFTVQSFTDVGAVETMLVDVAPAAIFFNFDYPDRRRLGRFADVKMRFPSVPVVMMTLQHSESLAIWAFRHGTLDYLIKPIDPSELRNCVGRILRITGLQTNQQTRRASMFSPSIPSDVPNTVQTKKDRLSPAIYYVQKNYSQRIYSDAVARLCGMSATHFSRVFKQTYDVTFQEFLLRYRVYQACQQLRSPMTNISDISYNVGFSDPSYFTRVFKRYVGVAPSDYQAGLEKESLAAELIGSQDEDLNSSSQIVRSLSDSFSA